MGDTDFEPYWDLVKRIINESDIVLEVLDSRVVELSRNEDVEKLVEEIDRPLIYVVNKSDLVSKESLNSQIKNLKEKGEVVYVSTKMRGGTKVLLYTIKKVFKKYGKRYESLKDPSNSYKSKFRETKADIVVGVLGYPNVGKSSIINSLAHRKKVKVGKKAGTTHGIHWIRINPFIKLIDSPGVIPLKKDDEIRYGLIGAKDTERLRHPDVVAHALIKLFLQNDIKKLEKHYDVKFESDDVYEIVNKIAERRRFFLKGGELDENKVAALILKDWQTGSLRL